MKETFFAHSAMITETVLKFNTYLQKKINVHAKIGEVGGG